MPASSVAWTSTDTGVARIDATGLIRTVRVGVATIRGTVADEVAEQLIAVTDPVLVGAGDIGTCVSTNDEATALLLDNLAGTVFTAGDNDYADATPPRSTVSASIRPGVVISRASAPRRERMTGATTRSMSISSISGRRHALPPVTTVTISAPGMW
ncbi:MAG: Ig-like domain-containing protein [Gemmatimonadales bacterium]